MDPQPDDRWSTAAWRKCPSGEVARLSDKLRARRRRRIFLRSAVAATAALVTTGGAIGLFFQTRRRDEDRGYDFGGITCAEVHRRLPDLKAGNVDMATMEKIKAHVAACPKCRQLVEAMGGLPS